MRATRTRRDRAAVGVVCVVLVLLGSGCSSTSGKESSARTSTSQPTTSARLAASVAQFRFDEGTRHLKAGVTNQGPGDVRVDRATIVWPGFAFPTLRLPDDPVPAGQTAAFTIAYGVPRCGARPTTKPVLVARVDGRTRTLPLHVDQPGLLDRLRTKACGRQRLDDVARVHLSLRTRTVRTKGEEYLPGVIEVRRPPGSTGAVRIVDLGGSVLIDLVPRSGPSALPATLPANRRELRFPVLFGSAHRCDAHALGQSSQTFLLSAYLKVPGLATQRVLLGLDDADRSRLFGIVHRDCR